MAGGADRFALRCSRAEQPTTCRCWPRADPAAMARRLRALGGIAVAAAALAALILFGLASDRSSSLGPRAPALPHERLAGEPLTLAGLLAAAAGRPVLVVFWASWCGPCAHEAPALERFSRTSAGRGRMVGVDWSDDLAAARSFIRRYSWTFTNLRDSEGTAGNEYHLTGLPTTFVLDGSGHVRAVLRGPQDEGSLARALASVAHS
jgi:cytochrome c biogenesis protein CcmG, thiol:disulfide interchange protein DsbE